METEIITAISTIGFPIVAFYLMYRMVNEQLQENTKAINNNTNLVNQLLTFLKIKMKEEDDNDGIN